MCGIAGAFARRPGRLPEEATVRAMMTCIAHRGPDDDGLYHDGRAALGFRRLSIIDLTTGHQPLHNEDRTVWTMLNGEIYNYREIREDLLRRGHVFTTSSDTEVLVHLYEERGEDMVSELRGMFAFAIWDTRRGKFLLARDQMGIKPIFYTADDDRLLFASEIKALMSSGLVDRTIDIEAADHYFGLQYVPAPQTIYRSVRKLPPGHLIVIEEGGEMQIRRYWDPADFSVRERSLEACIDEYEQTFVDAVRLQLRSDVPLGAFLSGGVDSSAVVSVMAELSSAPVNTFTITHTDLAYDESADAKVIADRFGTNHRTLTIGPDDFLRLIPAALEQYDQPFADASALPTTLVSRLAREFVTVVLSGDGSDETAGGYDRYVRLLRLATTQRRLGLGGRGPNRLSHALGARMGRRSGLRDRLTKAAFAVVASDVERHYALMSYFRSGGKRAFYGPEFLARTDEGADVRLLAAYAKRAPANDPLRAMLDTEQATYLPDDILYKVDVASMASSLEVRVPFLDHKLVEVAASIPSRYKVADNTGKMFLKRLLERRLPHQTLYRRKKGFEVPVSSWFRGPLAGFLRDTLLSSQILRAPWFDQGEIARLIEEHRSGRADHGPRLWTLMAFEIWHRKLGGTFD